jgi:hypothetical protein
MKAKVTNHFECQLFWVNEIRDWARVARQANNATSKSQCLRNMRRCADNAKRHRRNLLLEMESA